MNFPSRKTKKRKTNVTKNNVEDGDMKLSESDKWKKSGRETIERQLEIRQWYKMF